MRKPPGPHGSRAACGSGAAARRAFCRRERALDGRALLQAGLHVVERALDLGADVVLDRDDRNADEGGDEAVLDGRGARLGLM